MTTPPLVVARVKGLKLEFTSPSPFSDLFKAINSSCPVDKVYFVVEGPSGYAYREAGEFVLQFQPTSEAATVITPQPLPEPLTTIPAPTPIEEPPTPQPKARSKKKSLPSPGTIQVDGFIPGQDPPKGQPDPNSHLKGDFWKE